MLFAYITEIKSRIQFWSCNFDLINLTKCLVQLYSIPWTDTLILEHVKYFTQYNVSGKTYYIKGYFYKRKKVMKKISYFIIKHYWFINILGHHHHHISSVRQTNRSCVIRIHIVSATSTRSSLYLAYLASCGHRKLKLCIGVFMK